jgi:hypothetical protein
MILIANRKLASQVIDFEGLNYGKKMPTDIDAFMEFDDKTYIFVEVKKKIKMFLTDRLWHLKELPTWFIQPAEVLC